MSSVFDNLIDQEAVIKTLKEAIVASKDASNNSQNMTHSWLFTGPAGSGRSNAAIAFAAGLLCEKGGCGTCINCTTTIDGSHADIELVRTEGLSIKVDEVRELITRTSWSPSVGNYRVVVIEDADRLTESAANALLKVIEEPGARTVWLLCAPTLTDVIPTIRSRCRHLTLRTPSMKAVTQLLIDRDGIEPKMAEFAANAARGNVGRAKYLATSKEGRDTLGKIISITSGIEKLDKIFSVSETIINLAKNELFTNESEITDERSKQLERYHLARTQSPDTKKNRNKVNIKKNIDSRLLKDNLNAYMVVILNKSIEELKNDKNKSSIKKNEATVRTIDNMKSNAGSQLAIESLLCEFFLAEKQK
jgi:DNA polymerase-3 subunit delta'